MLGTILKPHLTFKSLSEHNVFHGITTRAWDSLNPFVGYNGIDRLARGLALSDQSPLLDHIVYAEQIHGSRVHRCVAPDAGSIRLSVDGLVSSEPSLILAVYVADCIPVLLYDTVTGAVAVLHAGRRGLLAGLIANAVAALGRYYGAESSNLVAGMGPGLRSCCYRIQEDIFPELETGGWMQYVENRDGQLFLDLHRACRADLLACGIPDNCIEDMGLCTSCRTDLFFSARKRTEADERGASFAAIISASVPAQ